MTIQELLALRDKAHAEYQKKLEAIDLVVKMLNEKSTTSSEDAGVRSATISGGSPIRVMLEKVVETFGDEGFTMAKLWEQAKAGGNEVAFTTVKKKTGEMLRDGYLEVIEKSTGTKPNILRRAR